MNLTKLVTSINEVLKMSPVHSIIYENDALFGLVLSKAKDKNPSCKGVLIEVNNQYKVISCNFNRIKPNYYPVIVLVYMLAYKIDKIKVMGAGNFSAFIDNGKILISGSSKTFGPISKEPVRRIILEMKGKFFFDVSALKEKSSFRVFTQNEIKEMINLINLTEDLFGN